MSRTPTISFSINGGPETAYPFILVKSDDRITPPIKDYEEQVYPESAASEIYPYTSKDVFDYSVTLLAFGDYNTVNASVQSFYNLLFQGSGDLLRALPVTIFNYWKGVKVTGYAKSADPDAHYPKLTEYEKSAYIFNFVIHVADPNTLQPI